MTITQLLQMPVGSKTGGFDLVVKRARKTTRIDEKTRLMEVIFIDNTAEINGEVHLEGCENKYILCPQSGMKIKVTVCWLQENEVGKKKLYVDQWGTYTVTADEWEAMRAEGKQAESDEDTVASMCRNTLIRHFIEGYTQHHGKPPECTDEYRKILDRWLGYNLFGK